MSKHTAGTLFLFRVGDGPEKYSVANNLNESLLTIVEERGVQFAAVLDDADAHLFAAAPDLLAACKAALAALSQPTTYPADIAAAKKWLADASAKAEDHA